MTTENQFTVTPYSVNGEVDCMGFRVLRSNRAIRGE